MSEHLLNAFVHRWRRTFLYSAFGFAAFLILFLLGYAHLFGPRDTQAVPQTVIVAPNESLGQVGDMLEEEGYIRSALAFQLAFWSVAPGKSIRPGGYNLSASMDVWTIATLLGRPPYLVYVTVPSGYRKEQIGDLLARTLGWTDAQKAAWAAAVTATSTNISEGVYYPDTYLIPSDQSPAYIAARMRARFTDVLAPYVALAAKEHVSWPNVLTLASLVEREAAKNDKALVAGVLANRLKDGMPLAVDATLQYIVGNEDDGWWPVPTSADKYVASPFNTYKHVGLPPAPIANPSLDSIKAVLSPATTTCLFYLHDANGTIHCSPTYKGHLANIQRYLK